MSDELLVKRKPPIATVIINRPQVRNALSLAVWSAFPKVVADLTEDPTVRGIIFRGAGREAFASGADISEFKAVRKDVATAKAYNQRTEEAYRAIAQCPKPTVAMIWGFCMGGAMALAMACDLRFAADTAKFGIPAARLGIIYGPGSVKQLVSLVGPSRAKDILYSARTFDAGEALSVGFVNRVYPPDALESATYEYLEWVAHNAPLSIRGAKVIVNSLVHDGGISAKEEMDRLTLQVFDSHDFKEGTSAFLEKRKPRFEGR